MNSAAANLSAIRPNSTPRWRNVVATVLAVVGCLMSAGVAAASYNVRAEGQQVGDPMTDGAMLWFLLGLVLAVSLCFRRRGGPILAVALCVPPILTPLDPLPALIASSAAVVWLRDRRWITAVITGVTIATLCATWRDTRGGQPGASFFNDVFAGVDNSGSRSDMPLTQVLLITFLTVVTFVGTGWWRRNRLLLEQSETSRQETQQHNLALESEIADRDAQEHLAREVHDVLGHRLSMLSMQANALEVEADGMDPDVVNRARQLQTGAQAAMTDLRSLIHSLRNPSALPAHGDIGDVATLIDECIDAGTPVASSIFVDMSVAPDAAISQGAHRITAELLTNARKHSPGALVRLAVTGNPAVGLTIQASNPVLPGLNSVGNRSGLNGIHQRAKELGGDLHIESPNAQGNFVATVTLPWTVTGTHIGEVR